MGSAAFKEEERTGRGHVETSAISYFDLNQLELAFINRVLKGEKRAKIPSVVEIGKNERILKIQKRNLEAILGRHGKERREGQLEGELKRILTGSKIFSLFPHKR
jgi:hypothetical protein